MNRETDQVCIVCGIPWKDGVGFIGKHIASCANDRYGWCYTKDAVDENGDSPHDPSSWVVLGCYVAAACLAALFIAVL